MPDTPISDQDTVAEVNYGRFVPPWISDLPIETTVTDNLTVKIYGEELPLVDPPFEPQTKVKVKLYNNTKIVAKELKQINKEVSERKLRAEKAKKARKRNEKRKEQIKREERKEFWNQYDIPINFTVVDNIRIGELQKGSSGTGRTKSSADHFLTLEPFEDGRLKRQAHEFLCKNEGEYWDLALHETDPVNPPNEDTRKITCKTCLRFMERWKQPE